MKFTKLIQKALNTAVLLHDGQKRKVLNMPYIVHPVGVALILSEYTDNENIIAAGLLHDVLEDVKNYSEKDMIRDFGEVVTGIVKEVSEDKDPNVVEDSKLTWEYRKKKYLENLWHDSEEALMVCAADKIHNLLSLQDSYDLLGEKAFESFNAPIKKKLWYFGEVVKILQQKLHNPIVQKLAETEANVLLSLSIG